MTPDALPDDAPEVQRCEACGGSLTIQLSPWTMDPDPPAFEFECSPEEMVRLRRRWPRIAPGKAVPVMVTFTLPVPQEL